MNLKNLGKKNYEKLRIVIGCQFDIFSWFPSFGNKVISPLCPEWRRLLTTPESTAATGDWFGMFLPEDTVFPN